MFEKSDLISVYTRAQAIADGVLVDLMQGEMVSLVREAGFRIPVAMTASAFHETIAPIGGELPEGQDLKGRLWDVLSVLRFAIKNCAPGDDRVEFQVSVWNGTRSDLHRLWALVGPGDTAEPVLTIMLEGED